MSFSHTSSAATAVRERGHVSPGVVTAVPGWPTDSKTLALGTQESSLSIGFNEES